MTAADGSTALDTPQGPEGAEADTSATDAKKSAKANYDQELKASQRKRNRQLQLETEALQELDHSRLPVPLVPKISAPAAFPVDALGPVLGPAARAIAENVQVPLAIAANSVLSAAGLAAQAHGDVLMPRVGPRPLSLFVLTIADSGDRKSSADRVALQPVNDRRKQLDMAYREAVLDYEMKLEENKTKRQTARTEAKGDELRGKLKTINDPPKPQLPKFLCGDPSGEGLMRSLTDGQYSQGIFSDEGGQFMGGTSMSEESQLRTIAFLSRVWDGSPLDRVRATDNEYVVLYGRRVSLHMMVQPKVATKFLGNDLYRSQGFLARFLVSAPVSIAGERLEDPPFDVPQDDPRIQQYYAAMQTLLERPQLTKDDLGGLAPTALRLSPEAREILRAESTRIERSLSPEGELRHIKEWAAKAAEQACRVAGVLTLVADPDTMHAHGPDATHVSGQTMTQAWTLVRHYLGEYQRLVGHSAPPERLVRAQAVLDWIKARGFDKVTTRQVNQSGPSSVRNAAASKDAIAVLLEYGWVWTDDKRTFHVHILVTKGGES